MCWDNDKHKVEADALPPPRVATETTKHQSQLGLLRHSSTPGDALIVFHSCRYCSDRFTYVCEDGRRIHIIAGLPKSLQSKVKSSRKTQPPEVPKYKAISYVWGETTLLPMYCNQCKANFVIGLKDVRKFQDIAKLAASDESIWLDTMSINQDDEADKGRQIAQMGKLYGDAAAVAVLLPGSDKSGFELLASLNAKADFINQNRAAFSQNEEPYPDNRLTAACNEFYTLVEEFEQSFGSWKYWSRAWTFQEWAMASTMDIGLEGSSDIISNIKYTVLYAATLMSIYKLQQGQYANIRLNFPRGEVTRRFNAVKRLFPDERAFLSADEAVEDKTKYLGQTLMPGLGFDKLLGLRTWSAPGLPNGMFGTKPKLIHEMFDLRGPLPSETVSAFKARLSTMLNAFAISQRDAYSDADKVLCWASMCNISFAYKRTDSYGVALQKVLTAIREIPGLNIRIFVWQVNRELTNRVDLSFLPYASLHLQRNARNGAEFYGTPVLNGRADTLRHFEVSLKQAATQRQLPGEMILVQALIGGRLKIQAAQMSFIDQTLGLLKPAISGAGDGIMVHDVIPMMRTLMQQTPTDVLASKTLVMVIIETTAIDTGEPRMCALWAIIPYDRSYSDHMVARECTNGQLVLIARREDQCDIVGYLTFTDQLCGTYLAWCNTAGEWLIRLDYPQRSDIVVAELVQNDIWWGGKYELSKEVKRLG
ncbi:hypothetical protein N431DRAFT_427906 [Stipitochalara longipes BDJ]|nr:hypothetical protein N431DRAFT_427906 [Stipitochalara longipes BDJ]